MRRALLILTAGVFLACAGGKDDAGGDSAVSLYQGSACQDLMSCYTAASPDDFTTYMDSYGPEGPCWADDILAQDCDDSCEGLLAEASQRWPEVEACGGEVPDPARWAFDDGDYDVDFLRVVEDPCELFGDPEFLDQYEDSANSLDAYRVSYRDFPGFRIGVATCEAQGSDFTCDISQGDAQGTLEGEFTSRTEADFTLTADDTGCQATLDARITCR